MAINEILSGGLIPRDPVRRTNGSGNGKKAPPSPDRVEVSGEARSLYQAEQTRRMDEIRERLDSGFYDRQEIIERIAEEVLTDLKALPE